MPLPRLSTTARAWPPGTPLPARRSTRSSSSASMGHGTVRARSIGCALDVGCGAGRSTAALTAVARTVVGIEPAVAMLVHRRAVAPGASFVVGRAEDLPFANASFDLVTAAGVPELHGPGPIARRNRTRARARRRAGDLRLLERTALPGGCVTRRLVRRVRAAIPVSARVCAGRAGRSTTRSVGLRLAAYEPFEVAVPLTLDAYLAYVLSEANVERAVASGAAGSRHRRMVQGTAGAGVR